MPRSASHDSAVRHSPKLMLLHWGTLAAIVVGVALILMREDLEGRATRLLLLDMHRGVGLLVLLFAVLRLVLRRLHARSGPRHQLPPLLALTSRLGHSALYLMLFAIPLLGWAQSSARGQSVTLFRLLPLPPLTGRNLDLADTLADIHRYAAWGLAALVAAHALAALWHHFVRRDHVLRSMLPAGPGARPSAPAAELDVYPLSLIPSMEQKS